jgi:hypothetical protein
MDIVEQKPPSFYDDELKKIIKILTFKKNKVELKGSSSLKSQRYFSDYDLFSVIQKEDYADFFNFITQLIEKIESKEYGDVFFIELKIQLKNGRKIRFFKDTKKVSNTKVSTNSLDFIKIDLIVRMDNKFIEISCIYSFTNEVPTKEDYIKSLEDDIKVLKKEKNYYKILKRIFSIKKSEGNKSELVTLTKIFNSELGKEYQLISNLEALQLLLKYYQDEDTIKKIKINLKDLKLPNNIGKIDDFISQKRKQLNSQAKKFLP